MLGHDGAAVQDRNTPLLEQRSQTSAQKEKAHCKWIGAGKRLDGYFLSPEDPIPCDAFDGKKKGQI
jgi:hypothetical protein